MTAWKYLEIKKPKKPQKPQCISNCKIIHMCIKYTA